MKSAFVAAALAALTTVVVDAAESKAVIVNIGGQNYDVTTFEGSYFSDTSKFDTPGNGGVMPWWGNSSLAQQFATAVGGSLPGENLEQGPYFAYFNAFFTIRSWYHIDVGGAIIAEGAPFPEDSTVFAQVTLPTPASVPGPLPIMGAATAFGMSRRLRRRIAYQFHKL